MKEKLELLRNKALETLMSITDLKELDDVRVTYFGKKGELTSLLKGMGALSSEERPAVGQMINDVRKELEDKMVEIKNNFAEKEMMEKIKKEAIDISIPGNKNPIGHKHPMTIVIDEIKQIFIGMGYTIEEGPEIELDYYNFEALNVPDDHPAKDEQDTFYIDGGFVLRTQTSPVQVRVMEKGKLPIKIIAPGRVFRSDQVDATHSPVFHQLEGMVVDKNITMGDLKGALAVFAKELLGENINVRFRPHYFPFTEPSAEMDVSCFACDGVGCKVCQNSGWIELLGCGMVHPDVLEKSGINPKEYSGFAFGMGLERIAMQKYGILDLRLMYENDVNFLNQF